MHLVMPWFSPLAILTAWLGFRTFRQLRSDGPAGRRDAWWIVLLMALPLFFWLVAQVTEPPGALP